MQANYSGKRTTRPERKEGPIADHGNRKRKEKTWLIIFLFWKMLAFFGIFVVVAFLCIFIGILPIDRHKNEEKRNSKSNK